MGPGSRDQDRHEPQKIIRIKGTEATKKLYIPNIDMKF
jgi:hypothetical protein